MASAAVIGPSGELIAEYGDPELRSFIRSAGKPFQILPFLNNKVDVKYNFTDKEIAVCCASHSGEDIHVETVKSILKKTGIDSSALKCGIHSPLGKEVKNNLKESGTEPSVLHNNCSGKHSAMLAIAKSMDEDLDSYLNPDHPVQQRILSLIKELTGEDNVSIGVDGCSAPVFYLTLKNMAELYHKLATAENGSTLERVWNIMTSNPMLIGGTDRFDTLMMNAGNGKLLSKMGAEGIQCLAFHTQDGPISLAVKVHDGSRRAVVPAVLHIMDKLGLTPNVDLERFKFPILKNHTGIEIGKIVIQA